LCSRAKLSTFVALLEGRGVAELRFEELVEPTIQQFRSMIAAPPLPLFATRNMRNESGKPFVNQGLRPAMIDTLARRPESRCT
jgi:hypothetical protein